MNRGMILAINTSTPQFGLALLDEEGTVIAEYFMAGEKGHFGSFMPALHFLFSKLNAGPRDLKAVITTLGPGSYTGLRVGISAAKGFSTVLTFPSSVSPVWKRWHLSILFRICP